MTTEKATTITKIVAIVLVLGLALYVAFTPDVVYAPVPKMVLFFLISIIPATLIGADVASKFSLKLPGIAFTTVGACAIFFAALTMLTKYAKPEEQIAVYEIIDENDEKVPLEWGAVDIPITHKGMTVTKFVSGNAVALIFPEQVGKVPIRVKKAPAGKTYSGSVTYAGSRTSTLKLGKELK